MCGVASSPQNIRKKLSELSVRFEEADMSAAGLAEKHQVDSRNKILKEWLEWRQAGRERYDSTRNERAVLRGGFGNSPIYSDDEDAVDGDSKDTGDDVVEEWVETVVEEYQEIVPFDDDD